MTFKKFILIEEYNPNWVQYFKELKYEIDKALEGVNYRIEHVGSTSVPKLASSR